MTHQDGYQLEHYCLSCDEWKRCENYKKAGDMQKLEKKLR